MIPRHRISVTPIVGESTNSVGGTEPVFGPVEVRAGNMHAPYTGNLVTDDGSIRNNDYWTWVDHELRSWPGTPMSSVEWVDDQGNTRVFVQDGDAQVAQIGVGTRHVQVTLRPTTGRQ